MTRGGARIPGTRALLLILGVGLATRVAASPIGDAVALFKQKKYAEARALLEPLANGNPPDASACYYLGMTLEQAGKKAALDPARTWLKKAADLAPENEVYLAEYAGVCLLLADRDSSLTLAIEGRNAMTRAIAQNPSDLDAREGLMTFYARAPWPLGDADLAFAQAGEIAARDPKRGRAAYRTVGEIFLRGGRAERAQSAFKAAQNLAGNAP